MSSTTTAERPPLTLGVKLLYGMGAAANTIKQRGVSTFLLLFYNQVVGLPPAMVSGAIAIALAVDAVVDPMVGQVSDNFRSRWGRRHPFMYAAALPVGVGFFLLWNPPHGWEQQALFVYMLTCLLVIRVFDTFFELPSSALLAELTDKYDERTSMIAIRQLFGVIGALLMTLAVYQVFLRENPDGSGGVTQREGWFAYSIVAAMIISLVILASSWGTHSQIPFLRQPPSRKVTFAGMAKEMGETLKNRSFLVLTVSGMFMSMSLGLKGALELYFSLYFWGLNQAQLSLLTVAGMIASVSGAALAAPVAKRLGKRNGAIIMFAGAVVALVGPIFLRLIGLMPPNGSTALFVILFIDVILNGAMAIMTGVMLASMIADVVEESEVQTGRRSEGLLMSADNLFKKLVSGVGVFASGLVLAFAQFPQGAKRGEVPEDILHAMAWVYLPVILGFFSIAILGLFLFRIDRKTHEDNLAILRARAEAEAEIEQGRPPTLP